MIHVLCFACRAEGGVALQHGNKRNLSMVQPTTGHFCHLQRSAVKAKLRHVCKMSVLLLHAMFKVLSFA